MPKKGKKGVDQRVKGNVKAASSGRMADLIAGESATGFIGFEAVSRGMGREGEDEEEEEEEEEVSHGAGAEFQVVMKQLGKRDATTKLKALQEFSTLCEREPVEAVVAVLNIWNLMYNKLSTDNDNRVREASHKALQSCVKKIKSSLGPHMRSILGSWVAGMCDPHGSAASAAQAAFSAAFTATKQTDVLKFGFKSIVNFVEDITLKQTQDTFSDPKVVPADERLQRYERVVTMSLYGLSLTLHRVPVQFIADRLSEWEEFVAEKRLWKLARHQNPYIRAASFTLVVSLCKHGGGFITSHARQFCTLVLGSLGEKEPAVVGPVWEATLLVVNLNEDWSDHVNVQKAVLPGVWQLLSGGGHGSARLAYPCLLQLLKKLVKQVYQSDTNFAVSFLERLKTGLQADRVRGSVSECEVVLQTFGQAFLYLLLHVDTLTLDDDDREQFYRKLMSMVVELVDYSVGQCPRTQANVVCGWVGRILDDLLGAGPSHPWIEQYLQGWLQLQLTERVVTLLERNTDKAHFDRMASLLRSLSTRYSKSASGKRVTFAGGEGRVATAADGTVSEAVEVEEGTEGEKPRGKNGGRSPIVEERDEEEQTMKKPESGLNERKGFLRPVVASLCAHCIAAVCRKQSVEHCTLLGVALGLYGETGTVMRIEREVQTRFPSLLEQERDGMKCEAATGEEDRVEGEEVGVKPNVTEVVVCLSGCLLGGVDASVISGYDPRLVEGVVSSILLLLQIDEVSASIAIAFLERIILEHPSTLLLLLTKLGEKKDRVEWVSFLLHKHQPLLLDLVRGGGGGGGGGGGVGGKVGGDKLFLWGFLDLSLTSSGYFEGEDGAGMKLAVFDTLSSVLQSSLRERGSAHGTKTQRLLHTLARATPEIVEDYFTLRASDGCTLLHCMLNWSLENCRAEASLLPSVCLCYSHLVSLLPEPASYLESTADLLTSQIHSHLERVFEISLTVQLLHFGALKSYGTFWSLYLPLRAHATADKDGYLPLGSLESFCSKQPYSPFFEDLSADNVVTSLSGSRLTILFLAAALCNLTTLSKALESLGYEAGLASLDSRGQTTSEFFSNLSVAFPVQDSPEEEKSSYYRLWKTTVCELMLALCALQPSQSVKQSSVESSVVSVLQNALEECMAVDSGDQHQWNRKLLDELIDRASMEGPLWCLVLQQFFTGLENSLRDADRNTVLLDFIGVVLHDPQPALVLAAISGLSGRGRSEVEGHLMGSVRGRENDVCLLCVCLHLLPKSRDDLLSLASRALSNVASKHGSSEIAFFESLDESMQDPMSFSLLEMVSMLVSAQRVPSNAWEFILCILVTITQLLSEATAQHKCSVNYTVFHCKAIQVCCDVAVLLASPLAPAQPADEWREFFSPDIQARLRPAFLNSATQSSPDHSSYCVVQQHLYTSRAVAEVCTSLEGVSLEVLIDILFSPLHPFKVATFFLAKRLISTMEFCVEEKSNESQEKKTAITVITIPALRTLLSAALGRVDLDLTFLDDSIEDTATGGCHDNTSSYLLLWLLVIEIMSHCGPEARASLGEWLKEQSLFPHLLHGLFTLLNETSSSFKTQIEVTLLPDLKTLSTVLYSAVARHLPSMLRQWYLSVDRGTSATVTRFTTKHVSPALQQTELQAVGKTTTTYGNMEVRAYAGASEVSVVYRLNEFSIELFVHLPDNYPLQPPSIREGRRVRMEANQWRKWMLQLNVFVANQNGTLMDGLLLWKSNLDKHFSGLEDCMICFSVIHGSLYSLPKMTCRTCKKKFHSACLYKWFSTSNKSSCPLCRNIF